MLSLEKYNEIKKRYGKSASWAIWAEEGSTPKSNISDLSIFNDDGVIKQLNPKYVFVGLNPSVQDIDKDTWHNFHSKDTKRQNDYKLRYALKNTKFWGAYLTDLVSDVEETNSNKVSVSAGNIKKFKEEIDLLGTKPILIAMGDKVYKALIRYFKDDYTIVGIKHFSCYISKEVYRKTVLKQLMNI